ncbi:hypothetical protein ASPCAL07978 [Aspergillus calidoustus]|uniref:Inner kinetochore subunit AME1 domain-containing protein n=1 Tax=Aspergillus calidoustus TaxID=454130 RepID=A0A0U5GS51_ASPCI|nr:hypothetical protein ASPCAL07978 [Aspergillus calidoustus]
MSQRLLKKKLQNRLNHNLSHHQPETMPRHRNRAQIKLQAMRATTSLHFRPLLKRRQMKHSMAGGVVKEGESVGVTDSFSRVIALTMIENPMEDSIPVDTQRGLDNGVSERAVEEPTRPTSDEGKAMPIRTSTSSAQNQTQDRTPSAEIAPAPADGRNKDISNASDVPSATDDNEVAAPRGSEPIAANGTTSPPSDTARTNGKGRGRKPRSSPEQNDVSNAEPAEKEDAQPTIPSEPTVIPQEQDASAAIEPPKPQRKKRGRTRTPATVQASEITAPTDEASAEDGDAGASSKNDTARKAVRGRKRKNQEVTEKSVSPRQGSEEPDANQVEKVTETQDATAAPEPVGLSKDQPNRVDKGKKRAGRPRKVVSQTPEPAEQPSRADTRKKRGEAELERDQELEEQPESDKSQAAKRKRQREQPEGGATRVDKRRKRKERDSEGGRPSEQEEQPESEAETSQTAKSKKQREEKEQQRGRRQQPTPEPEPENQQEAQVDREQAKTAKGRRGRRPETQAEGEPAEETSQAPKRKPRQPRGETVPVTVHRIVNATSLGGVPAQDESASEEDAESPEEMTTRQADKLPTRSGVNAADVLAQICRETLEKTLTTLKNGIDNEANAARRQEWTLRRKAVEAFGTELEGRLFELSEMLDSNFMLGVKVKKAKRNMMDLRARLDQVRREREAIALRTDAVRREHMIAEKSRMARSTISHSLHNLDLALERGQNRTTGEDESLTAGLEFRLRNAAQNVSSTAPGAHGGILNQIKRFNAQLEATARQLEG